MPVRLFLLVLIFALPGCPRDPLPRADLWGRWEMEFEADSPLTAGARDDVAFTVVFTSRAGQEIRYPGFWAGGNTWKVRFMPRQTGIWEYRTESAPAIAGLHDQSGRFEVDQPEPHTRFEQHGPIEISDNGRHFVHANGTPFLWMGDTAWNGALKSTEADWQVYLEDRAGKGFTGIQFVTTQWRAADGNAEGETAYSGFEDIEINAAFFDRIDHRIDAINAAGMLAAPVLLWTLGEPERNPGKLPESQAIKLGKYLIARYGAHHVIWLLAGDENFGGETGARWRRIGRAVFDSPIPGLATIHPQGRQWHFDDFAGESWLDFIIYQSSHGGGPQTLDWLQTGPPAQQWDVPPVRPVFNSEPGYEDHVAWETGTVHTGDDVRKQFYWSLLNTPIAGLTYGAHGIWSWETAPATPMNHANSGMAKPWHEAMHLPGSTYLKHAAAFFESIDWSALRPAQALIMNQSDDPATFISAAAADDGRLVVFYLPPGVVLLPDANALADDLQATWFNPRDGSRTQGEIDLTQKISAPDQMDWVLLLEK